MISVKTDIIRKLSFLVIFWLAAYVVMYISFLSILDARQALINTTGFVLPIILPVLVLDLFFEHFFLNKKYWKFGFTAIVTIAGFGFLNFYLLKYIVQNPEAESNTILSIIFFFLIFRGIKFF